MEVAGPSCEVVSAPVEVSGPSCEVVLCPVEVSGPSCEVVLCPVEVSGLSCEAVLAPAKVSRPSCYSGGGLRERKESGAVRAVAFRVPPSLGSLPHRGAVPL